MVDNSVSHNIKNSEMDIKIVNQYENIEKKGRGRNFILYKAQDKETLEEVAIKKYHGCLSSNSESKAIYQEIVLLEKLSNFPNIIFLHNVVKSNKLPDLYLVFEYVDTNLKNIIYSNILRPIQIKFIAYQLILTLNYIHSADVLHMDIKPSNILLNDNCEIKLTDFGLSKFISNYYYDTSESILDFKTIRWYKSPELILGSMIIDQNSDIWSYACILVEMVIGKPIFPGNSTLNQLELILQITGKPNEQDLKELENYMMATCLLDTINCKIKRNLREIMMEKDGFSEELYDLVSKILVFNPKKRLNVNQIIKHKYFEDMFLAEDIILSDKKIDINIKPKLRREVKEYQIKTGEEKSTLTPLENGNNI